jgi:hypothetical protein
VHGLYALYRLADQLESSTGSPSRVMAGELLARAGDIVSGIPH